MIILQEIEHYPRHFIDFNFIKYERNRGQVIIFCFYHSVNFRTLLVLIKLYYCTSFVHYLMNFEKDHQTGRSQDTASVHSIVHITMKCLEFQVALHLKSKLCL